MDWLKLEEIIRENVPKCVKTFLSACAYDTFLSIQNISCESIHEIERHINTCPEVIQTLDCCHSDVYKNQSHFQLLPGHKDFILSMSKYNFGWFKKVGFSRTQNPEQNSTLPVVLQAMIQTTHNNAEICKHHAHYDDLIRYFSTYVFLLSGRSCYEFLRTNLNLPSTKTVCM